MCWCACDKLFRTIHIYPPISNTIQFDEQKGQVAGSCKSASRRAAQCIQIYNSLIFQEIHTYFLLTKVVLNY